MKSVASPPRNTMRRLTMPLVGDRNRKIMPMNTTIEMKCGM